VDPLESAALAMSDRSRMKRLVAPLALSVSTLLTLACAPRAQLPAQAAAAPASADQLPKEIHWTRTAAEHEGLFRQVYRSATDQVDRRAQGLASGSWAVILDADETVLDNSPHYLERSGGKLVAEPYDPDAFTAWGREARAPALPGSAEFIAHVKRLGGRVVIVTNRIEALCDPTRENFRQAGIVVDAVLCRPADTGDKNPRFEAVQRGTTPVGLPALNVLLWVGDNIQDFPRLTQTVRGSGAASFADFGVRYFLLPNPIYGSWETNPVR
jgi:5'-nucleotidase (lipoprotein e(P4) family)